MKYDIVLAGVGGQGVLSLAAAIARAASRDGLEVRQSEVHGMAQRGGAVQAHLRISDRPIHSDLISRGSAEMILSMEPVEGLRYADFLAPHAILVSAREPFVNIGDYPDPDSIWAAIVRFPRHRLVSALELAKQAGSPRAVNMVMVGAASPFIPLSIEALEAAISGMFAAKGSGLIETNLKAFRAGRGSV
jgi:indolepyruvate ferredoxin oxidoreductase beta subunit